MIIEFESYRDQTVTKKVRRSYIENNLDCVIAAVQLINDASEVDAAWRSKLLLAEEILDSYWRYLDEELEKLEQE